MKKIFKLRDHPAFSGLTALLSQSVPFKSSKVFILVFKILDIYVTTEMVDQTIQFLLAEESKARQLNPKILITQPDQSQ